MGAPIDSSVPEQILSTRPGSAQGWLDPIYEIRKPGKTADSIRMIVTRALAWLADPAVAAATTPGPDEGFKRHRVRNRTQHPVHDRVQPGGSADRAAVPAAAHAARHDPP